jgi:hypothetical protein
MLTKPCRNRFWIVLSGVGEKRSSSRESARGLGTGRRRREVY